LRGFKPFLALNHETTGHAQHLNCSNQPFQVGDFMPIYILLSTLTSEGRKTIKSKPERIKEVNKEIEAYGAKVLQQYAVLGRYDFVNIVEAPNNDAITRVSIELGSRGTVHIMSMPATPIDDFLAMLEK
jgi:uncharacterized protein with GYD domain